MKSAPAQIVREYGLPRRHRCPRRQPRRRRVWFATGDSLQSMDPASGKIVSIIKMTARAGTAYDGRHLYQLAGPSIQKVDRAARSWPRCQRPPKAARHGLGRGRAVGGALPRAQDPQDRPGHGQDPAHHRLGPLRHRRHLDQRRPVARHLGKRRKRVAPRLARNRRGAGEPAHAPGVYVSGLEAGDGVFYCGGSTSGRIRAVRQPEPASESR